VGYSRGTENQWANIFVQSLGPLGIDVLLGKCGAIDQLFDQLLGGDCSTSSNPTLPTGGGIGLPPLPTTQPPLPPLPGGGSLPTPLPSLGLPLPLPSPSLGLPLSGSTQTALPDTIGVLVDGALWGWRA
jgi:hypothetical protein